MGSRAKDSSENGFDSSLKKSSRILQRSTPHRHHHDNHKPAAINHKV